MAAGLKGRTRDLYCGISSGDFGLGELGPDAGVREEKKSPSFSAPRRCPSPAIRVADMYLTRARQPSSSQAVEVMRVWNEWQDWKQVVKNGSLELRSWLAGLGSSRPPSFVVTS